MWSWAWPTWAIDSDWHGANNRSMRTGLLALLAGCLLALAVASANAGSVARYGGLGATKAAFYAQNPHGRTPPPIGLAYYTIDKMRAGRVTAYHVQANFRPRASNRERIVLLAGINLPIDATETSLNRSTCIVWHSTKLKRLIGMAYAAGTTRPGTTTATMRAERTPHC